MIGGENMDNLWLFYHEYYQQLPLKKEKNNTLTIGSSVEQRMTVGSFPFTEGPITIEFENNGYTVMQQNGKVGKAKKGEPFYVKDQGETLMILLTSSNVETKTHYAGLHKEITFSSEDHSAIFTKRMV